MRRVFAPLFFLALFGVGSDSQANSDSVSVQVTATLQSYIEIGQDELGEPYVLSNASDPWHHLVHVEPIPSSDGEQYHYALYTKEETEPLLWNGEAMLARREQRRKENEAYAAAERARQQAEDEAGAAGDLPSP